MIVSLKKETKPHNIEMSPNFCKGLPFFVGGKVITGFGRGSKELGIPTANFPMEVVEHLPKDLTCGVYFGWANVNLGPVYKMVMNVGWCPYYKNEKKSMETHIMHNFDGDFYGALLKVVMVGYIRPEKNFTSVEELIAEIKNDIAIADAKLDELQYSVFRDHSFFKGKDIGPFNVNNHKIY